MSRWTGKYVIGLTGNIATGKSVVRQMLQHSGAYTIDADRLSHQAMMPGAPAYQPVIDNFGKFIVNEDGRIDRAKLAKIVFSDPEALKKLEGIIHPVVRQAIQVLVNRARQRVVVIEAIKLLEGELADLVDAVWVVDARPQTQYQRLVQKRKMSQEEARRRITAQNPQSDKLGRAHVIINNDGSVDKTWEQVRKEWEKIRQQLTQSTAEKPAAAPEPAASEAADEPAEAGAPAKAAAPEPAEAEGAAPTGISVQRGMPNNAQEIADFMSQVSGQPVSRMDIMTSFGQKSYLIARDSDDRVVATVGWTVENLVTRVDEVHVLVGADITHVIRAMVVAVEKASRELQSEVGFIFLPQGKSDAVFQAFRANQYEPTTPDEIRIPAWREAVKEVLNGRPLRILWKQLRQDRVLQPI